MKRWFALLAALFLLAGCGSGSGYTSQDAIDAFVEAGLEVGDYYSMETDDYGPAPKVANEGTRFLIPSQGEDFGGRVMSFDSQEDLELVKDYYVSLGESSALFFSWTFEHENLLVQINGSLDEETARQYEAALQSVGK